MPIDDAIAIYMERGPERVVNGYIYDDRTPTPTGRRRVDKVTTTEGSSCHHEGGHGVGGASGVKQKQKAAAGGGCRGGVTCWRCSHRNSDAAVHCLMCGNYLFSVTAKPTSDPFDPKPIAPIHQDDGLRLALFDGYPPKPSSRRTRPLILPIPQSLPPKPPRPPPTFTRPSDDVVASLLCFLKRGHNGQHNNDAVDVGSVSGSCSKREREREREAGRGMHVCVTMQQMQQQQRRGGECEDKGVGGVVGGGRKHQMACESIVTKRPHKHPRIGMLRVALPVAV
ncbi:unnamed protein product [Vitrella brassicaformis CCMP3155]|uniref:Uncharacterized protein n=1 Tax=Vitrella brassicaformis (strain CCMP3155) TaxID=1169540 RepID=A0A0G4EJZ1_VITBC|nr:unnamed protein product [Vitrella brassicaformis CCMP3155]|eukprot:CEL97068.1 unnamed protein product [Vitrella brassicaformis CCMP3155]